MQETWDTGSVCGSGRSFGGGHGNPLQYSCLESPMDRGAWWAIVHRVAKSRTRLKQLSTHIRGLWTHGRQSFESYQVQSLIYCIELYKIADMRVCLTYKNLHMVQSTRSILRWHSSYFYLRQNPLEVLQDGLEGTGKENIRRLYHSPFKS